MVSPKAQNKSSLLFEFHKTFCFIINIKNRREKNDINVATTIGKQNLANKRNMKNWGR